MAAEPQALRAQLARLRDQGQAPADGWRLDLAQALLARLDAHAGLAQERLLARIDGLLTTAATPPAGGGCVDARPQAAARPAAALAALTASLQALQQQRATAIVPGHASQEAPATHVDAPAAGHAAIDASDALAGTAAEPGQGARPEPVLAALPALEASRRTWARLRTGSQLRQSLAAVDEQAGPLNSGRLVHRALVLMQDCSPGYLQQFVAYADILSSLESLCGARLPEPRTAAAAAGRPARPRSRKRRG